MTSYREPDQTARVEELEAEVESLKADCEVLDRRAQWRHAVVSTGHSVLGMLALVLVVVGASMLLLVCGLYLARRSDAEATTLPDGRSGFSISCEIHSSCVVEAGRACKRGYEAVEAKENYMLVVCKEPKP